MIKKFNIIKTAYNLFFYLHKNINLFLIKNIIYFKEQIILCKKSGKRFGN
jgi:hypothetical protein